MFIPASEIATYLSCRYIEVKMLPLAYSEYLDFCGFKLVSESTIVTDGTGWILSFDDAFCRYLNYGGTPTNEVDFVATKDGKIIYVQVADELYSNDVLKFELKSLLEIPYAHEKIIVVRQGDYQSDIEGVRIVEARDFFTKDLPLHHQKC